MAASGFTGGTCSVSGKYADSTVDSTRGFAEPECYRRIQEEYEKLVEEIAKIPAPPPEIIVRDDSLRCGDPSAGVRRLKVSIGRHMRACGIGIRNFKRDYCFN